MLEDSPSGHIMSAVVSISGSHCPSVLRILLSGCKMEEESSKTKQHQKRKHNKEGENRTKKEKIETKQLMTIQLDLYRSECHTFKGYFFDGMGIGVRVGRSSLRARVGRCRRRVRRHASVLLPSTANAIQPDALLQHAHPDAFLEPAGLTGLPPALIDLAIVRGRARVLDVSWNELQNPVRYFIIDKHQPPHSIVKTWTLLALEKKDRNNSQGISQCAFFVVSLRDYYLLSYESHTKQTETKTGTGTKTKTGTGT